MNEQNSKKIVFNKSTLWSLKAELLKKQEEICEKKQLPQHKIENFKPLPAKTSKGSEPGGKDSGTHKKSFKERLQAIDTEELEACRKARAALEKKAELYEHLSDGIGKSQLAGRFLVDFNTKKQQESQFREPSPPPEIMETLKEDIEDDSEWTEFTDCLGRTRKCHKSDLDFYKKRDSELTKLISKDKPAHEPENSANETEDPKPEKPLLVQKTNDYLQLLRDKWEQKEMELLSKDKDIHYQDLLFDEARMHGVAYYSFSTDEAERRRQMEELIKRREETQRAQQEAEEQRKKRDELMAARVAAARARMRARAGLPPEEPQESAKDFTTCLLEFLTKQKDEADAKAKEEERKKREEQEKERQKLRDAYVREWDVGKEGVQGKVQRFREMTQEEYVEQQRSKRIDEFAPPQASSSHKSNYKFDDRGRQIEEDAAEPLPSKSWADVRPKEKTPPPPNIGDVSELISEEKKGLYFSTFKKTEPSLKYKNFVKAQDTYTQSTLIINEVSDEECDSKKAFTGKRKIETTNAEIAPPPTYDYYGPIPKYSRSQKPFDSDINEAYAQGAKSLESKSTEKQLPKHYDFTFD